MCLLLEPLSFCLWQLSGTHSPKESFLARFRTYRTVALSAPALHDARAHLAGHSSVRTVQQHLALRLECPNIASSTHHARHADAKRADIIIIACEVEQTKSQSARPSLGGWRMARRMGQIRASGVVRTGQVRPRIATVIILIIIIIFLLQTRNHRSQHHGEQRCQMLTELTEQSELPGRGVCWLVDLPWGWLRKRLLRLSQRRSACGWLTLRGRNPAC